MHLYIKKKGYELRSKGMPASIISEISVENRTIPQPAQLKSIRKIKRVPPDEIGVLLCGLNEYSEPAWSLRMCVSDMQRLRRLLVDTYKLPARNIKSPFDATCTKSNILKWMDIINRDYKYRLYGHSGRGYKIFNSDTNKTCAGVIVYGQTNQTWQRDALLLDADINAHLAGPKTTWLWIDACFSGAMQIRGAIGRVKSVSPPHAARLGVIDVPRPKFFVNLFACGDEPAYEDDNGGRFTTSFTEAFATHPDRSLEETAESTKILWQHPQIIAPNMDIGFLQIGE